MWQPRSCLFMTVQVHRSRSRNGDSMRLVSTMMQFFKLGRPLEGYQEMRQDRALKLRSDKDTQLVNHVSGLLWLCPVGSRPEICMLAPGR